MMPFIASTSLFKWNVFHQGFKVGSRWILRDKLTTGPQKLQGPMQTNKNEACFGPEKIIYCSSWSKAINFDRQFP